MKYNELFMNKKSQKIYCDYANKSFLSNKNVQIHEYENATILPAYVNDFNKKMWALGGVVDQCGHFIHESESDYLFGGIYEYDESYVDYLDEVVIYMGPFVKHWGHFICDQISRLWYILENPSKYKIAYCGWNWNTGLSDISGNYLELIQLLGVKREQLINIQKVTKFKKVIIPDFCFYLENGIKNYTKEFIKMTDVVVKNVKTDFKSCPENIYLTRLSFKGSLDKERGEENLVSYLKKKEYTILSPEKLTLSEQIFYLNHCKNLCMMSGSISHNLMFVKSNINVTILNKVNMINNYQMVIDHITAASITYVDVYKNIFPVLFGLGPFLITVNNNLCKWGKMKCTKKLTLKLSDYIWYIRCYHRIYSNSSNKNLLIQQNNSLKEK